MACKSPVGPHAPTFPLPASNYRNQPNDIWSAELNVRPPKVNNASLFLRDYSTTPGVGCGFMYFRSKAVLDLPVSTTSYSRNGVSTNSNMIRRANNGTVLNRHRRDKDTQEPCPAAIPIYHHHFPSGLKLPFISSSTTRNWIIKYYISRE